MSAQMKRNMAAGREWRGAAGYRGGMREMPLSAAGDCADV